MKYVKKDNLVKETHKKKDGVLFHLFFCLKIMLLQNEYVRALHLLCHALSNYVVNFIV